MDKEYIERKALLKDIDESVVFSTRDDKSAEMRGARKVMYRIMAAPTVDVNNTFSPWFSVNDKELLDKVLEEHKKQYPNEDDVELIVCSNTFPRSFMLFYDGMGFFTEDCNRKRTYYFITHWMPLPQPYKESIKQ